MRDDDVVLHLFPLGVGDADVAVHDEVPVLLTARASTTPSGGASAGRKRHVTFMTDAEVPVSPRPAPAPVEGAVVPLTPAGAAVATAVAAAGVDHHYVAANHLSELQRGAALARRVAAALQRRWSDAASAPPSLDPAAGFVACDGGRRRCYYVYPVEGGRYMCTATLPALVWRRLGGGSDGDVYADWLVHTALRSRVSSVGRAVAEEEAAHATHVSLHARLRDSPTDVWTSMDAQVRLLASVAARSAAVADREMALRRLCREATSPLRTHPRLWRRMEELLRAATSSTDAASVRGVMPTMGLPSSATRYVTAASAVWYRGTPLYNTAGTGYGASAGDGLHPAHATSLLRHAALSAVLEEMRSASAAVGAGRSDGSGAAYTTAEEVALRVAAVCLRTRWQSSDGGCSTCHSGYVSATVRGPSPASTSADLVGVASDSTTAPTQALVSLAFASSSGWTVALLLRALRVPFLGAPLSTICSGVQQLVEAHFESAGFVALVRAATAAMRCTWQRPVELVSPLAAAVEAAVRDIRVVRRTSAAVVAPATRSRDVLVYHFNAAAAAAAAAVGDATVLCSAASLCAAPPPPCGSCVPSATRQCGSTPPSHHRCALGAGEAFSPSGAQTAHGGGAAVEALVRAAARYPRLAARVQRGGGGARRGVAATLSHAAPHRSRAVYSVFRERDVTRVVQAVPHGGAVTYAVVTLDPKTAPAACEEYRGLTLWLLSRCW
ncbi:hypothetical protein NESM_000330700 [Novymonas esmeraldas]|uniref:Uncharacterized protein n=1 Tax=Novymonas esmeraldas TaxID=1808958 RepID=A0AAW0EKM7_9TRYP